MSIGPTFVGDEDALTEQIIGFFFDVGNELGFDLLESVYCRAMASALRKAGLQVASEVQLPVHFRGEEIGIYKADLVVEKRVILELKIGDAITRIHKAQLLHYLRASILEVGLILCLGQRCTIKRLQFSNTRKGLKPS